MRVPEEAVVGIVKVTLSFPAWKDREVAPVNTEFRLGTRAHHERSRALEVDASEKGPDALEQARQRGAAKAAAEIKADRPVLLHYGKPWSVGKPLMDDATGLPVKIVAGSDVTAEFAAEVSAYNAAIRAWHAGKQEGQPQSDKAATEHTAWLAERLREMQSIQSGMTRADLLEVFREEEGGLSTRMQRRYAYRGCALIKVDVTFEPIGAPEDKRTESPQDKITRISKPFLEGPIID